MDGVVVRDRGHDGDPIPDFDAPLQSIARRPGMYVGRCSIHRIGHYLRGYEHALSELGCREAPLDGWQRWVESRFLISHPAWNWTRILLHVYESDEAAVAALPDLHRDFTADRARIGIAGIEAALESRLRAAYGVCHREPPVTATTADG